MHLNCVDKCNDNGHNHNVVVDHNENRVDGFEDTPLFSRCLPI